MSRIEYYVHRCKAVGVPRTTNGNDAGERLEMGLNMLGSQGWEMCFHGPQSGEMWFKRHTANRPSRRMQFKVKDGKYGSTGVRVWDPDTGNMMVVGRNYPDLPEMAVMPEPE